MCINNVHVCFGLQFSSVGTAAVLFGALGSWILSARHWFKGPVRNIDVSEHDGQYVLDDEKTEAAETPKGGDGEEP